MKDKLQNAARVSPAPKSSVKQKVRHSFNHDGAIAETSLKLFFGLFVSLIATMSLVRLLPYHFAQSAKLTELRAQVRETEYKVKIKRQQLQKNFDSEQIETLMEEHSPRIGKDRVRVFLQQPNSPDQ